MSRTAVAPGSMVRAVVIDRADGQVRYIDHEVPEPASGEVLLQSAAVGLCGSDIDVLLGGRPEGFTTYPVIPGHEWSAVVARAGPNVDNWVQGDAVAVAALMSCGECIRCRDGETNLCDSRYSEFGFTLPGGLAEFVAVPARCLHRLPDSIYLDVGPLLEPAAVIALAIRAAPRLVGRAVAVVGDGTLGQLAAQQARAAGAGHVAMFGTQHERLRLAASLGVDTTYDVADGRSATAYRLEVQQRGADVVFECGGSVSAVELAVDVSARGARVVLTGVAGHDAELTIPSDTFVVRSLSIAGVVGSTSASWSDVVRLAGAGRLDLSALVSHRFRFEAAADAYAAAVSAEPGTLKVVITHAPARSEQLIDAAPQRGST